MVINKPGNVITEKILGKIVTKQNQGQKISLRLY